MKKIIQLLILCLTTFAFAQDGTNDSSFNPSTGADSDINVTAIQSDGKIIVGGNFTVLNNVTCNRLARLNVDGTFDVTFNIGLGFNNAVNAISIQPNGKIVVTGNFTLCNGSIVNRIVRLNADGTIDSTFNVWNGADGSIYSSIVQPDGKIILAGNFSQVGNYSKKRVVRLNTDGTVDLSFNNGTGPNGTVLSSVLQADGKIIIGGNFTTFNGVSSQRIARLNSDGTLDATFNSTNAANNTVRKICLQSDGKIVIGGDFTSYNGTSTNYIARLNSDSTIDTTFNIGSGFDSSVYSIFIQSDGKLVVSGNFYSYKGVSCTNLVRLNVDGSMDSTFNSSCSGIRSFAIQTNGKLLLGGIFTRCNNILRNRLASINADGSADTSFYPFLLADDVINGNVNTMALQSDGKIFIGGDFYLFNGISSRSIARLTTEGIYDPSFNVGAGTNGTVSKIIVLSNGKIIIVGAFTTYNGVTRNGIARLNTDGTLDTAFNAGVTGLGGHILTASIQTDGKIVIGGTFDSVNGVTRYGLARLNVNGTLDTSFDSGTTIGGNIKATAIQSDGKILVGALFSTAIFRLNVNGTLDTTFNVGGAGADFFVWCISVQTDGKIIIGGDFNNYNNVPLRGVVRLNTNGSLDTSFNTSGEGINIYGRVSCISIQNDGKIIIGGGYNTYNGIASSAITRLNTDGTIDNTFITGTGFDGSVLSTAIQTDGKILAGGIFYTYNGIPRSRIARLNNTGNLSVENFNVNSKINIYPNPVKDYLKFKLPNNVNVSSYEVFDLIGKKIDSNILQTNFIDVNNYIKGIYFLHLKTDKGISTFKFIKI